MTNENLIHLIGDCCKKHHLAYENLAPRQVSPGIWSFYAVEMNDDCNKRGHCRQMSYYARILDNAAVLC